jgi:hypothetical protein
MKVQIGKMILYGILSAIFYIAVPLILFEILGTLNIMTFNQAFKISILIFGIVGVVFSMLRHLFPKDTSANRLVAFGATVYSGLYLFYMFGGFTPGVSYGTYTISISTFQVLIGLQLIAWLLLASSGVRALQYLVEAIEIRKQKEYSMNVRKKFKLSKVFKVIGTIMSLVIMGYFGSLVYSGLNLGFDLSDPPFTLGYNDGGSPLDPSDDSVNMTMSFDVSNQGLYAIYDVFIDIRFYTTDSANISALPNTLIGESLNNYYGTFHSFTITQNNSVTVDINPSYIVGFVTTSAKLVFKISFSTLYAGILVALNISFPGIDWPGIIP